MAVEYPPLLEREQVDGVKVVRDEVLQSGLSASAGRIVPIHGIRLLTLDDGTQVHGCRDCVVTGTRGDVVRHRNADHNTSVGSRRATAAVDPASGLPAELAGMTLGEMVALAASMTQWGDLYENERHRADTAVAELAEAKKELAATNRKLKALRDRVLKMVGED